MRRSVPSWAKGGTLARRQAPRPGGWLLRQRRDHRGRVGLRDAEALCQGRQQAGRGIAEGAQGRQQGGQEDVHPLMGLTLSHAEETSLDDLKAVRLQVREEEAQAIVRRGERAVLVDGKLTRRPGCPIEAPRGHMRLERRLKGRDQLPKLVERQTRQIQERCGAILPVGLL